MMEAQGDGGGSGGGERDGVQSGRMCEDTDRVGVGLAREECRSRRPPTTTVITKRKLISTHLQNTSTRFALVIV